MFYFVKSRQDDLTSPNLVALPWPCTLPTAEILSGMGLNHTTYSRNNMDQKCEGNCGLWVLYEIIKKIYPESMKKIERAVWELPAK